MTSLGEQIETGFKEALKTQDKARLSILRLLRASLKNREVDRRGRLADSEVVAVIKGMIRQGREAIEQYQQGGRADLADKERKEIDILNTLLPAAASDAEIAAVVDQIIQEVQAAGPQDLGRVMKPVLAHFAGRADGRQVQALVKAKLSAG